MQTEWSPGRNGEDVSGLTSSAAPAEPLVEYDVDTSPETDAASDDAMAGEVQSHRSEVDAVDQLLDEVELAMARLDDGTYGRCETCGVPINDVELAAGPLVRECTPCSSGALAFEDA